MLQPYFTQPNPYEQEKVNHLLNLIASCCGTNSYLVASIVNHQVNFLHASNDLSKPSIYNNFATTFILEKNKWVTTQIDLINNYTQARYCLIEEDGDNKVVFMALGNEANFNQPINETFAVALIEQFRFIFLLIYNQQVEEKTRLKTMSVMSHDIRGPLGNLAQIFNLYNRKLLSNEELLEFMPKAINQINETHETLNHLINWGSSLRTDVGVNKKKTSPAQLVQSVVTELNQLANTKEIVLITSYNDDEEWYDFDKDSLTTVLKNLTINAIKFCTKGCVIELGFMANSNQLKFYVTDNGSGFNQEIIPTQMPVAGVFASQYGTAQEKGFGLGLHICKNILDKNHGQLKIESEPGKTTATVTLQL